MFKLSNNKQQFIKMSNAYYKLRDWIPINNLDNNGLSENPNAIHLLEKTQIKLIGLGYPQIQIYLHMIMI